MEWIVHPSPLAFLFQSEDEMDTDARSGEQNAIHGLLEMAAIRRQEWRQATGGGSDENGWGFEDFEA